MINKYKSTKDIITTNGKSHQIFCSTHFFIDNKQNKNKQRGTNWSKTKQLAKQPLSLKRKVTAIFFPFLPQCSDQSQISNENLVSENAASFCILTL